MRSKKAILLLLLSVIFLSSFGQQRNYSKSAYSQKRHSKNPIRMSKNKAKIVCPIFENSQFPYQGLGIKLGDPFALTYKFYADKKWGFVVDFGKAASALYSRYYREKFNEYIDGDTIPIAGAIDYLSHQAKADLVGEVKVLRHFDLDKVSAGLRFYIGVGFELKSVHLTYDYLYDDGFNQNKFGRFEQNRFTYGPEAIAGIEYSYFQMPISAFMEVEVFTDVGLDPGWSKFQGGVGLRYIFK